MNMAARGAESVPIEEFKILADQAGLGLSQEELEELKPMYELYLQLIKPLRSVDFKVEEIGMAFRADWPPV